MAESFYPLHRPEIAGRLDAGNRKLQSIFAAAPELAVKGGQTIVRTGEAHKRVYRLKSGWCARLRYLSDGRAQVSALLLPGDLFCVRAMFLEAQPDEIATLTDCTLGVADEAALRAAAMADADLMLRLSWQTVEDDRRLHNWLLALSRGDAEERMALLFLDIRGRLALSGQIGPDAREIPWPFTQQAIGDMLGITSVHVNRTLKQLRQAGVLAIRQKAATLDLAALHRIAAPLLDIFERNRPEYGAPGAASLLRSRFSGSEAGLRDYRTG